MTTATTTRSLTTLTKLATAFSSWEKLEAAMTNGYIPTLDTFNLRDKTNQIRNGAVVELRFKLKEMGYQFFTMNK